MARPLRIEYEGAFYHITARGDRRGRIFLDDSDRTRFLMILTAAKKRFAVNIHAFVLMNNHYHLLLETPLANLSKAMGQINGTYTQWFNRRHNKVGHVLQGRYKSIIVNKDEYYLELIRYIHLNPVRAGTVKSPDEYKWSSHMAIIGDRSVKSWPDFYNKAEVIGWFGRQRKTALNEYLSFISAGIGKKREDVFNQLKNGYILGQESFVDWIRYNFIDGGKVKLDKDIANSNKFKKGVNFNEVISAVRAAYLIGKKELLAVNRGRNARREARLMALHILARYSRMTLKEIGALFGGISDSAVSQSVELFDRLVSKDKLVAQRFGALLDSLLIS